MGQVPNIGIYAPWWINAMHPYLSYKKSDNINYIKALLSSAYNHLDMNFTSDKGLQIKLDDEILFEISEEEDRKFDENLHDELIGG